METADVARIFEASGTAPTAALAGEPPFSTRPELIGTFGMVTSSHWLATASGMAILEKGGNAFDAAIHVGDPGAKGAKADDKVVIEMLRFPSANRVGSRSDGGVGSSWRPGH